MVVVVEDDFDMQQAMIRLLRAARFHALAFSSAEALLEAGVAPNAGCLVLDVNLPGMTGFELHQQLAEGGTRPPVVFVTAFDGPVARAQAAKTGAIAFLRKPFEARSLIEAVRDGFSRVRNGPGTGMAT